MPDRRLVCRRAAIGDNFAWMEGILLLATLAKRWRLRLVPGRRVELQPLITLRPRYGLRMTLERREARLSEAGQPARPRSTQPL